MLAIGTSNNSKTSKTYCQLPQATSITYEGVFSENSYIIGKTEEEEKLVNLKILKGYHYNNF